MEILAYILIFTNLLIFKIFWDCKATHLDKRQIDKGRSAAVDLLIYAISAVALLKGIVNIVGAIIIAIGARGLLFDLLFNWVNGWKWHFCGTTSKVDVLLDSTDGKQDGKCIIGIILKLAFIGTGITIILIF